MGYIMYLGLNPGIYFSSCGFRPTVDYLMFLGLSCGFKPRVDLFEVYGSEPRDQFFLLWVQTQISLFQVSGSGPRDYFF